MKPYLRLMRIHHYIKNLLIFLPLIFSGQFFCADKILSCLLGFVSFCLLSSAIYIVNDLFDREQDRLHPTKCHRPIASGDISTKTAYTMVMALVILSISFNIIDFHISSTLLLIVYFVSNIFYSFQLKNLPIIDVTILVSGFFIRVAYGAIMTGITVSYWLYLTIISVAFYFALGKRRNELMRQKNTREVLKIYSLNFLDKNMYMCLTLANTFYALWSVLSDTAIARGNKTALTVPLVLLLCLKYSMNIEGESDGDPVEVLLHDKVLLFLCFLYAVSMFSILYI